MDQVSPVKQKSVRETAFINSKEGAVRSLGKSMSFKSPKSTQLNDVESKVKMLSPRSSHDRDMEGPKKVKDKSLCENSLRSDHTSCVAISSSRSDKKSSPHGDPSLQSTVKVTDSKLPGDISDQGPDYHLFASCLIFICNGCFHPYQVKLRSKHHMSMELQCLIELKIMKKSLIKLVQRGIPLQVLILL